MSNEKKTLLTCGALYHYFQILSTLAPYSGSGVL